MNPKERQYYYYFWPGNSHNERDPSLRFGVSESLDAALHQRPVAVRSAVAEELPGIAHLGNHVEVQVRHHDFIFVPAALGDDLAARRAEVALAVELADIPRSFRAHTVERADKISVGHGMRGLFQLPQIL